MPDQFVKGSVRFTPEEIRYLMSNGKLTLDVLQKMHPDDAKVADQLTNSGDFDISTGNKLKGAAMMGVGALPALVAGGVPAAISGALGTATGLGGMLKSSVGGYLGYEGGQALGDLLHLPGPLRTMLGLAGAHVGGGFGKAGKSSMAPEAEAEAGAAAVKPRAYTETAPMSEEAYQSTTGHPRGQFSFGPSRPDGGQPTSVKPGDYPPNVSTTRNSADVAEQVTGSSRKGYADSRSFDNAEYPLDQPSGKLMDDLKRALDKKQGSNLRKPASGAPGSSKAAKFHEADQGAQELEELLNRTGRLDPLEGASNGLLPAESPAPSSMRRKPR